MAREVQLCFGDAMPVVHIVAHYREHGARVACECSCGWISELVPSSPAARKLWQRHARGTPYGREAMRTVTPRPTLPFESRLHSRREQAARSSR